jgi:intracellular sulfur oxidation DsrE/DsrF family protein
MKSLILSLFFLLFLSSIAFAQIVTDKEHKIIFQLTDGHLETQKKFLRQINNVLEAAPNAKIEVVTHGMGVDLLRKDDNELKNEISELKSQGVDFVICENTLKQRQLKKEIFLPEARFVPSAIIELVLKQEEGWIYIKAG